MRRLLDAQEREDFPAALACIDPDVDWVPRRAPIEGPTRATRGSESSGKTPGHLRDFQMHFELRAVDEQVLVHGGQSLCAAAVAGSRWTIRSRRYLRFS